MEYPTLEVLNQRAKDMKDKPTPAEKEFRSILFERGIKHETQVVIVPYIVDFLVGKTIIEIDGSVHQNQVEYDARRTLFLNKQGYKVVRVSNWRIDKFDFNRLQRKKNKPPKGYVPGKKKRKKGTHKELKRRESHERYLKLESEVYEMVQQPNGDFKRVKILTGKHDPITNKGWR